MRRSTRGTPTSTSASDCYDPRVRATSPLLVAALFGVAAAGPTACSEPAQTCTQAEGLELYTQRIEPLLAESRPSSCNNCHLSGIDLERYATGDPCSTMACLVEEGLVSLDDPASSTILTWIERAEPDSGLITEAVIQEEYEGFRAWIEWSASCGAEACGVIEDPCADRPGLEEQCVVEPPRDPSIPPEAGDPGDCSDLTIESLFRERVYVHRGRCYPCHFESQDIPGPNWVQPGPCNEASLASMRWLQASDLIDRDQPANSRLLLKPLAEDAGGLEHGGHDKFENVDDPAYQDFAYWIERWVACEEGGA